MAPPFGLRGFEPVWGRALRPSAAVAALATVALYGMGSVAGVVHFAGTRHEVCLDHGELVHTGHDHRSGAGAAPSDRAALHAANAAEGHDHDHCNLAHHLRLDGLAAPVPTLALVPTATDPVPALPADRPHHPVATLRLAPKHSPPAAA